MAVKIRMKRLGRKHRPFYRICVMDSRKPRDGKAIEEVGTYDPMVRDKSKRVELNLERVDYWISVGAQPSDNVANMIKKIKTNQFGTAAAPAPLIEPKPLPEAEPEATEETASDAEATADTEATADAEAPAEGGEATAEATE